MQKIEATRYGFMQAGGQIWLVTFWYVDGDTGATCWTAVDSVALTLSESVESAWNRLRERNRHLLTLC